MTQTDRAELIERAQALADLPWNEDQGNVLRDIIIYLKSQPLDVLQHLRDGGWIQNGSVIFHLDEHRNFEAEDGIWISAALVVNKDCKPYTPPPAEGTKAWIYEQMKSGEIGFCGDEPIVLSGDNLMWYETGLPIGNNFWDDEVWPDTGWVVYQEPTREPKEMELRWNSFNSVAAQYGHMQLQQFLNGEWVNVDEVQESPDSTHIFGAEGGGYDRTRR